ncbi:MAG: hypothetical protein GC180_04710 [Bacteroidetes bacterium]|nr:hypothetical protein [Bacteroidota bacterium]
MKNLFLFVLLFHCARYVEAQSILSLEGLGIEVGYTNANFVNRPAFKQGLPFNHFKLSSLNSFSMALTKTEMLTQHLTLLYRAGYTRQGFNRLDARDLEGLAGTPCDLRLHRAMVDVNIRYSLTNKRIRPYVGMGIRGLATLHSKLNTLSFIELSTSNFNKLDWALLPAAGLEIGNRFRMEAACNIGMRQALSGVPGLNERWYNRSFTLSLGYVIRPTHRIKYPKHRGCLNF